MAAEGSMAQGSMGLNIFVGQPFLVSQSLNLAVFDLSVARHRSRHHRSRHSSDQKLCEKVMHYFFACSSKFSFSCVQCTHG